MFKLFVVASIVAAAAAFGFETEWTVYKAKHNKRYHPEIDTIRKHIWNENLKYIEEHNKRYSLGLSSFYLGENEYADMTNSEFVAVMNGHKLQKYYPLMESLKVNVTSLPDTVDWRTKGYVTGIKNQGQCGSCWAFSTTGSIEGQHFKKSGKLVSLSESNLVDCSTSQGNHGCQGGLMDDAFKYVIFNHGIDTEASYPYHAKNEKCHFKKRNIGATISSYKDIPTGSESALQQASAMVGPISVAIDASHASFQLYSGGVYDEPNCSTTALDHGVLVVGYGTDGSTPYWLVKNSWGTSWGLEGYIMMSRNKNNQCGIATTASYPIV